MSDYGNDPGTEAEALSEQLEGCEDTQEEIWDRIREENQAHRLKRRASPTKKYQAARNAKVGTMIKCPTCGKPFKKKSYQQVFCSNRGLKNCKDRYWNP